MFGVLNIVVASTKVVLKIWRYVELEPKPEKSYKNTKKQPLNCVDGNILTTQNMSYGELSKRGLCNMNPNSMKCQSCLYFEHTKQLRNNIEEGMCKRYPPHVVNNEYKLGEPDNWPIVLNLDWCGEFKKK